MARDDVAYLLDYPMLPNGKVPLCAELTGAARKRLFTRDGWREGYRVLDEVRNLLPKEVHFWANLELLRTTDFPLTDVGWLIVSRRMLSALIAVALFEHERVPLIMDQHPQWHGRKNVPPWYGKPQPRTHRPEGEPSTDYVGVCLSDLDCFDWTHSKYERWVSPFTGELIEPPEISDITKMVLVVPAEGFPPLFRVKGDPLHQALVSGAARRALDAAGIKVKYDRVTVR